MKNVILAALLAATMPAMANHPDSVYVRPDVREAQRDFQIAYSIDKKHWKHIDCTLFSSDYGTWGSQKKMYWPVLSYDGKKYHITFIPDPKSPQTATSETDCLYLWKPQDYPMYDASQSGKSWRDFINSQKAAHEGNIIRIPYSDIQALMEHQKVAAQNAAWERDNYVASAAGITQHATDITARMSINWDDRKAISPNLMGVFFEDISYAADGGLYAELIQNRDFEYNANDHKGWHSLTAWRIEGEGMETEIKRENPISQNNASYLYINATSTGKARIINEGWDGIPLKAKAKYNLSMFLRGKSKVRVSLVEDGKVLASATISGAEAWKQCKAVLVPSADAKNAQLVIEPLSVGEMAIDFVSLFPQDTYKGRANGMRKDLAEAIADLKPRFVRFPGGCASHGQGIDNIYHWQATIGELWERQHDMNIWNYHQTRGIGFYEYFQYCEDIGAEALPVLAAGVPCQNSWRGGNGQQGGIPFARDLNGKPSPYSYMGKDLTMESYLQELLDLIEWANGDAKTSKLAAMRAKAGHPKPFNMKYLGIGNEDLIGDVFLERYRFLVEGVKKAHPEITVVGTVGPFWEGSDYEYGWKEARERGIEIVDEHYYNTPGWYFHHRDFYDNYDRNGTKVYLGEWASKGNNASNALIEAAYLTNVERNADVVVMSSYAPLLAKEGHTNWNPDLIYFNNTEVKPTANYYVQRAFGQNAGTEYIYSDMTVDYNSGNDRKPLLQEIEQRIDRSVVVDENSGDIIIKLVSTLPREAKVSIDLKDFEGRNASITIMACPDSPDRSRSWATNETTSTTITQDYAVNMPAFSFAVIRIHNNTKKK